MALHDIVYHEQGLAGQMYTLIFQRAISELRYGLNYISHVDPP